ESLLKSGAVDADFVLGTVNGLGNSPSLEDLARLLVPRGISPRDVASTAQFGSHTGDQHEVIAGHLAVMGRLEDSSNPAISAVGEAGRVYFVPLQEQAIEGHARKR